MDIVPRCRDDGAPSPTRCTEGTLMIRLSRLAAAFASLLPNPGGAVAGGLPPGFVRLADVAPSIRQDIRYAGHDNFTGRPVPGYGAPQCWLRREAAEALARVQARAEAAGLSLIVYDCYRPQRATDAFVNWAQDPGDQARKADFYPDVDKARLFAAGYIGRKSAHSLGTTVDAALTGADGARLDFGTPFDLFSPRSATRAPGLAPAAAKNRADFVARMAAEGFENYKNEWWHFTLRGVRNARPHDIEIR